MKNRKVVGALGEKIAIDYLRKKGYTIKDTNYRCRDGEIDIIAQKSNCLSFVEVRTRIGDSFGLPEESITPRKASKLIDLAEGYLQTHGGLPPYWRIDFIAVELTPAGQLKRVELIENAVYRK